MPNTTGGMSAMGLDPPASATASLHRPYTAHVLPMCGPSKAPALPQSWPCLLMHGPAHACPCTGPTLSCAHATSASLYCCSTAASGVCGVAPLMRSLLITLLGMWPGRELLVPCVRA
eukprot:scaffold45070_cov23-Tisochrysis_lutea.AAC.1